MHKRATQILAILGIILIVWFIVPLISFNHIQLLPTIADKFLFIVTIFFFWSGFLLIKFYRIQGKEEFIVTIRNFLLQTQTLVTKTYTFLSKEKKRILENGQFDEGTYVESNLILTKHFQFVKDYCSKHGKNKKYPVYLLIGNKYAGKTSLLSKSELSFKTIPAIESPKSPSDYPDQAYETVDEVKSCAWNIHDDCIFIDTPGDYANSEINENLLTSWRHLLNLLVYKYQKFPIKALVLVISMYELVTESQQNNQLQLQLLKQRIIDIKKYYGEKIPLHIIFTKWDAIPGFTEFFDHLSADERQKIMTIKFNKNLSEETAISQFKHQYDTLLQNLSHLLILRMHQEHNSKKRALLSQFPLQMEQLQKVLVNVVKQLIEKTFSTDVALPVAMYFTSNEQNNETVDILFQKLKSSFNLPEKQLTINKPNYSKTYFIYDIFQEFIHCKDPAKSELTVSRRMQYAIYGFTGFCVFSFAIFTLIKFTNTLNTINHTEITAYESAIKNHTSIRSHALTKNVTLASTDKMPISSDVGASETIYANSHKAITSLKSSEKTNTISSDLQNYLETILTNNKTTPIVLYNTLKVYLMLGEPKHFQFVWLTHWLEKNAIKNGVINADAAQQIMMAIQKNQTLLTPQTNIIEQARKQLTTLPKQYLAFLILRSDADYVGTNALSVININKKITVPFLFTAQALQTLVLNNFNQYVTDAIHGNWVLGEIVSKGVSKKNIQQEFMSMYTMSYINWWNKILYEVKIPAFTNLQDLTKFVTMLDDPKQGIIHGYTTIIQNANPNLILPTSVKNPLVNALRTSLTQQINTNLSNLFILNLADVESALSQFTQFLNTLTANNNISESAFLVIKNQFENSSQPNILTGFGTFATTLPDPLNTQFSSLAQQSQQLTEQAASSYLQNLWQTQVLQFYNEYLVNRYPLYSNSAEDIDLNAFTKFFGPNGILQTFYANNLSMFINGNSSVWQWQTTDGLSLPLSDDLLLALEKGRIITTMFFPDESQKISVNFTLQQVETMPIVQTFSLNINGQSLRDPQGTRNISSFIWPGNSANLGTQISFLDVNGQRAETERQGVWSWFRILDMNSIHNNGSSKEFSITFDIDGNEARYHLSANNPINPFIPGIIDTFRLPETVTN